MGARILGVEAVLCALYCARVCLLMLLLLLLLLWSCFLPLLRIRDLAVEVRNGGQVQQVILQSALVGQALFQVAQLLVLGDRQQQPIVLREVLRARTAVQGCVWAGVCTNRSVGEVVRGCQSRTSMYPFIVHMRFETVLAPETSLAVRARTWDE